MMSSITYLMNVLSHEFRSELKLKTLENQKIFQKKKKIKKKKKKKNRIKVDPWPSALYVGQKLNVS